MDTGDIRRAVDVADPAMQHGLRSAEHKAVVRGPDWRRVIRHSLENPAPLVRHTATCYSYSAFPGFDENGAHAVEKLPDQLQDDLRLVFVGTAASYRSADVGHY
jgi:hypothetical protein